jgi:hypothetical protein
MASGRWAWVVRVVLPVAFASAAPADARGCERKGPPEGFLLEPETVLPSNVSGFAWAGVVPKRNGERILPPVDLFAVEFAAPPADASASPSPPVPAPFDLRVDPRAAEGIVIVAPRAGIVAGSTYRLTFKRRNAPGFPLPDREEGALTGAIQTIVVSISRDAMAPSPTRGSIERVGPAKIATLGDSCGTTITAVQQQIQLKLPAAAARWQNALVYTTKADGSIWDRDGEALTEAPPAPAWAGPGKRALYARCAGEEDTTALAPGDHAIVMTGWLPGTDISVRGEGRVPLVCKGVKRVRR